jgi:hypothetical protein
MRGLEGIPHEHVWGLHANSLGLRLSPGWDACLQIHTVTSLAAATLGPTPARMTSVSSAHPDSHGDTSRKGRRACMECNRYGQLYLFATGLLTTSAERKPNVRLELSF